MRIPTTDHLTSAYPELLAFAVATRRKKTGEHPDTKTPIYASTAWDETDLRDAMTAAHTAGWPWNQVVAFVYRMIFDPQAEPNDLREACRSATRRDGQAPGDWQTGAAHAREALTRGRVA